MPRDQEGTRILGWILSSVRFGLVSDIKVCKHNGRYSIEVYIKSLFQDQTVSWIRIVNGIDKFVRESMPIQEEEKASVKPAAKARPILTSSSISDEAPSFKLQSLCWAVLPTQGLRQDSMYLIVQSKTLNCSQARQAVVSKLDVAWLAQHVPSTCWATEGHFLCGACWWKQVSGVE